MLTVRRAFRAIVRVLAAAMVGGALAVGPRTAQVRPAHGAARVELVLRVTDVGAKT